MKKLTIGLFGFGTVGEGIYQVLSRQPHSGCEVKRICIKHPEKERGAPPDLFTTDRASILDDEEINVVVELISDDEVAFLIVSEALKKGKSVVSANKKMIATHHDKLIRLQHESTGTLLYEAAVCGSIPILRSLQQYFGSYPLGYVTGIVNGSTNYILSQMNNPDMNYQLSLAAAIENGFAERDPREDVEGFDASYKLSIIGTHAFGKRVALAAIARKGITSLKPADFAYAKEWGYTIKLIATAAVDPETHALSMTVLPTFLKTEETLSGVSNEYNGVLVGSSAEDEQFFYGKGAGRFPTSSAVLADIAVLQHGYSYAFRKGHSEEEPDHSGRGKFYLGFDRHTSPDRTAFTHVEETFENGDRVGFIAEVSTGELINSGWLERKDVSVIAFRGIQ